MESTFNRIGQCLSNFQAGLRQQGITLEEYIDDNYKQKWLSDELFHIFKIKTTFMNAATQFLANEGLINLEKILMSVVTDPLAHDIEHTPVISYKGNNYVTTHSMIYSKLLACSNPKIKGVFTDSPNIRLELESPNHKQRGRYLIDFSQIDIEVKRDRYITLDEYFSKEDEVLKLIKEDCGKARNLFERMIKHICQEINKNNQEDIDALGVQFPIPKIPFPTYSYDYAIGKYGKKVGEEAVGEESDDQFFWITGIKRENYDLIYPFMKKDGSSLSLDNVTSDNIFNYDLVAKTIKKDGTTLTAKEILSGGVREWLYKPIVERILANKVLKSRPIIKDGYLENIEEMAGYGPFLMYASMKKGDGSPVFPATMGGGLGVERFMFATLRGENVEKIDDVTFFGKNPDSHSLYLF